MRSSALLGLVIPVAVVLFGEGRSGLPPIPTDAGIDRVHNLEPSEPAPTHIEVGDRAPSFSYLAPAGGWQQIDDLLAQGPLLMVFGAEDDELRALQAEREEFLAMGIIPAAVVDMRPSSAVALARRLKLGFPLISDPKREIARVYNSLDPWSARHAPGYFVMEKDRTVRALWHGRLPDSGELLMVSARSLHRPLPRHPLPASAP